MHLEGDISEIQRVERLVDLWREQFTGAIRFENDGIIKIIYFKGGDVLSASTNDRADSIDEILMRAGKVSREHVKQALAKRKENETLGDALLNLGFITRKELTWARRVQVVGVIRSIAAWPTGSFTIVADYLPKRDEGTLFPLPQVLVELVVTEADRQRFEGAMDGGAAVFTRSPDFEDVFRRLGLNEEADTIVAQIDGQHTAAEIALASGKDTFNVYKLLDALALLRILRREAKPQPAPEFSLDGEQSFATAGVADAADMWDDAPPVETGEIGGPQFQLDETEAYGSPTLEVPGLSMPPESDYQPQPYQPIPAATSVAEPEETPAWDEMPLDTTVGASTEKMPAWDNAPPPIPIPPIPARKEPVAAAPAAPDEQWGFDEAQIDAVRRADVPVARPPIDNPPLRRGNPPRGGARRYGLLVALMLIFIGAAAGYFGFLWWQGRQDAEVAAQQPVRRAPRPVTPVPTGTIVETPVTDTAFTSTSTTTTTTTAPSAGLTITTPPVTETTTSSVPANVATATTAPAPVPAPVRTTPTPVPAAPAAATPAADALRTRYDAMAHDFAANPTGNYTVQFAVFCQPSSIANAMKSGGNKVWFVKYGSRCYQAYFGHFDGRDEAVAALANLPPSLRDANAKVVAIAR
ncbi:MAG: hypothetical protein QOH21_2785 [Acidobacteriota bacterium]|nr:hypothetical protein [Acidobacteriota bacterium]